MRRQNRTRPLAIIAALVLIWAAYLFVDRPAQSGRAPVPLDWANIVWLPLVIIAVFMVWRYLMRRNDPTAYQGGAHYGLGEAVASGVVWAVVKTVQEYFWYGTLTAAPLVSGLVVFGAILAGNWILSHVAGGGTRRRHR